jgi:hypothetical protein
MSKQRFESDAARKRVVAVVMAAVLACSLGLSLAMTQPAFSSLPVPEAWEEQPVPASVPLRPVKSWVDPERPSRRLVAGFLQTRSPGTDLPAVLGKAVQALSPVADAPSATRDQIDVLQTRRLAGARYRGLGEGRNGRVGQHLVTVLTSRQGSFTRFLVLYLQEEIPEDQPELLQENQQFMDRLWSTATVLP